MNPVNGYYYVPMTHNNYKAMIDLLYKAVEQKWTIYARTSTQLDSNGFATVLYFVVDY
jgi:redox-regulated HSP33 family molecular chaperone